MSPLLLLALFVMGVFSASQSFTVVAAGTTAWSFTGGASGSNPRLTASVGDVLSFTVTTGNGFHPFSVHTTTDPGVHGPSDAPTTYAGFNSGVPGLKYTTGSGPITATLTIGNDIPSGFLYYVCQSHTMMVGTITIGGGAPVPVPAAPTPAGTPTPAQPLCLKYAAALGKSQSELMNIVVTKIVQNEVANAQIVRYFNGAIKPPNFLANTTEYNRLANGLIQFFGSALGCTDASVSTYTGRTMSVVHTGMGITLADFNTFNSIFITSLAQLGVSQPDQNAILGVLNSFQSQIVQSATPNPTPIRVPTPVRSSGNSICAGVTIVALVSVFLNLVQ